MEIPIASGKRTQITNWKIHPFFHWENQLFPYMAMATI